MLVRITASGTCHSDLHIWSGHFDLGNGKRLELKGRGVNRPFTMGHEIVGEVAAFSPDVDDARLGDHRIGIQFAPALTKARLMAAGTLQEMHALMDLVKAGGVDPTPITPRPMAEMDDALNDLQAGRVLGRVVFTT